MEERFECMTKELIIEVIRKEGKEKKFDLSESDLSWSDLSWSDLSGSDLSWSDLSGSDLRWSDLSGSDLSGSIISKETLFSKIKITNKQKKIMMEKMFEIVPEPREKKVTKK